jgi:hypothetical protein
MASNRTSPAAQNLRFPDWQRQLQAALLETDPTKLQQRIFSLEEALVRLTEFLADTPDAEEEKLAIGEGLRTLRVLQVEKLNFPDWKKKQYWKKKQ